METIYTVQEVADIMKVEPRTIKKWLTAGSLKGFKLSDSPRSEWRITGEQLQNFIKQRMEKPTDIK